MLADTDPGSLPSACQHSVEVTECLHHFTVKKLKYWGKSDQREVAE